MSVCNVPFHINFVCNALIFFGFSSSLVLGPSSLTSSFATLLHCCRRVAKEEVGVEGQRTRPSQFYKKKFLLELNICITAVHSDVTENNGPDL